MKHKVVQVKNVNRSLSLLRNLNSRSSIIPGLGLIHGPSGFGKTTTVVWMFNQARSVYVRCYATDTPSSFLSRVLEEMNEVPRPPLSNMVRQVIDRMVVDHCSLFIDEADHIVQNTRIMETIRDIYDSAEQPVVLIGMEQIARRISHRKQMFNRISEWVEFQPCDLDDMQKLVSELFEEKVTVEEDLLSYIRNESGGEMRQILVALEKIERFSLANQINSVSRAEWGREPLFLLQRR
ncbi:AAA family ATPase [Pseudidiomarina aestuarii]|uniref:AAA family ATPase n=1 Tax=Pseudidiomarina aestuarii TaxID=624146 RepID=UPI003A9819C2